MCIFNISFAYRSDWLIINNKGKYSEFCMGYSDITWYVGSGGQKYYPRGLSSANAHIFNTSFAYFFWFANNKKKYSEFCMGYSDTWYVGSGGYKYPMCACHHRMCISNTTLAYHKKANLQNTSWHSLKGDSRCLFYEYRDRVRYEHIHFWLYVDVCGFPRPLFNPNLTRGLLQHPKDFLRHF